MSHATFPTEAQARAYQSAADKAHGYPSSAHVHIGGGRHVKVDPDKPGPGWTMHLDEPRKHPSKEEWCHVAVAVPTAEAISDKELGAAEVATLTEAEPKELDESWDAEAEEKPVEPKPKDLRVG